MVMGAYARKHSRYHRSVECETDGALQILWNLWKLHRFAKVLQICETGVMEKQETQRPNVLADVEEIYEYPKDTSTGVSKDISEKCLLGKWLIEEPYALIGHVRFCEGLLRLEPLIAKQYMMKGCEKSRQSLLDENMKKLVKRSDVMQETLEAYCSCSCSCYGTCSCSTGQTNNSAALFQARYTQFYMDFVAIRMV